MKKSILYSLFIALGLSNIGCHFTQNETTITQETYNKMLQQTFMLTPDSLMTLEQLELKLKVMDYLYENIIIDDCNLKLSQPREDMERHNIPSIYYDVITYQLKEIPQFLNKEGATTIHISLQEMWHESSERYWRDERDILSSLIEAKR